MHLHMSKKVAVSGITTALSVLIMYLSIVPGMTYALPAVAGMVLWIAGEQSGRRWGLLSYGAAALLSMLLVPEVEAVSFFAAFFGWYPVVRGYIDRIKHRVLKLLAKLAAFNIPIVITFQILSRVLGLDKMLEGMEFMGQYAALALWITANVAFFLYDFCIDQLLYAYTKWMKPRIFGRIK